MRNKIYNQLKKIYLYSVAIFFDDVGVEDVWSYQYPKNLTNHYKNEITDLYLDEIWVITDYDKVKKGLEKYKYQSEYDVKYSLSDQYIRAIKNISTPPDTTIVPVPMHWLRYTKRSFDHMWHIAKETSTWLGMVFSPALATKYTVHQALLNKKERLANRKNRFIIKNPERLSKNIVLIDDIISTWSTANECAKTLKSDKNVKRVVWVFLASNQ